MSRLAQSCASSFPQQTDRRSRPRLTAEASSQLLSAANLTTTFGRWQSDQPRCAIGRRGSYRQCRSSCDNTTVVSGGGITVYRSNRSDLPAWRVLALEVEQLFGAPMANNDNWIARLRRHIERGTAWCASIAPLQEMVGGMWLSSTNADAVTIAWLAVRREARRRGVGSALVGQALTEAGGRTVRVVTFGEGHPMNEEADAARDLYRRLGFKAIT